MSDDTEITGTTPATAETGVPRAHGTRGFFASTAGRILVIVFAVIVLIGIALVVGYLVLGSTLFGNAPESAVAPPPAAAPQPAASTASTSSVATGAPQATSVATSSVATVPPPPVPDTDNRDVFTPRDPFKPIAAPVIVSSSSGSSSSSSSDNTLVLTDITSENGTKKAVVTYNGKTYTVAEGETVDSSPWKVLEINNSSVVMLFGDVKVTLTIGQGITK